MGLSPEGFPTDVGGIQVTHSETCFNRILGWLINKQRVRFILSQEVPTL